MWDFEKHLFLTVIDNISKNNIIFVKWRKASTPPNPGRSIFGKWNFFIFHFFLGRRIFFHKVIQVWEFPSNFISRYDWIQLIWKKFILSSVMWKPSIYGCFIEIKWITFSTWRKPSDPSFVGVSSYIFLYNDASRPTIHLWALYRDFLFKRITFSTWRKPSDPSFVGASSNIFL